MSTDETEDIRSTATTTLDEGGDTGLLSPTIHDDRLYNRLTKVHSEMGRHKLSPATVVREETPDRLSLTF